MARTQFLPKGLTYKKVERKARWITIWEDPDGVLPKFEILMKFMTAKRQTAIFMPVASVIRGDDEDKKAQAMQKANSTFIHELVESWRGFTVKAHDSILRSDLDLSWDEEMTEEQKAVLLNTWKTEGMEYNEEWCVHIYANAPGERFSSVISNELGKISNLSEARALEGNVS